MAEAIATSRFRVDYEEWYSCDSHAGIKDYDIPYAKALRKLGR